MSFMPIFRMLQQSQKLACMSSWQQRVLQSVHTDTHFHLAGQDDVCQTHLGTRPGDCYADIVFSLLWARLLRSLEQELTDEGILDSIPAATAFLLDAPQPDGTTPYLGPTWMDDSCVCLAAGDPTSLERATSLLLHKCESFAMTPNLAAGKTELMLVFQGKGAREAKVKHFGPYAPGHLPCSSSGKRTSTCPCCDGMHAFRMHDSPSRRWSQGSVAKSLCCP